MKDISCDKLQCVGPKTLERLHKLGLFTVQDLLFHLPARYEDRTKISPIRSLRVGDRAVICGVITKSEVIKRTRPILQCTLRDATGSVDLYFFNFYKQRLQDKFIVGAKVYCVGDLRWAGRVPSIAHPEYKILGPDEEPPLEKTLTPIYPTTDGLSQSLLRKVISQAIKIVEKNKDNFEYFTEELLIKLKLQNLTDALRFVHLPESHLNPIEVLDHKNPMKQRLIFDELLSQQLSLLRLRLETKDHLSHKLSQKDQLARKVLETLPFSLTKAQERVHEEIKDDLKKEKPMLRLLQGDVGSGKTIVAALTMAKVVESGYQVALVAPTELLAEQHFKNLTKWLSPFGINVVLLSNKIKGKERKSVIEDISSGKAQVVIGTHAIFQEKVNFKNLALIVIDEQHRFGVDQRALLRDKGFKDNKYPHQLIMTATPIPRTLTMTIYADLDCSVIDELPKGRAGTKTLLIANSRREELLEHIRKSCREGRQVYWVCPLIEDSEYLDCKAAETLASDLIAELPDIKIGLVHGRKKSDEKESMMQDFSEHKIDLLVATTVIEVGVDVPNASLMIIENAERLGLVQLHQLRGRVGRGSIESFCVLLYQNPVSYQARQRLHFLRDNNDGFLLAQKDLEMRGSGEMLGTRQTGLLEMRVADIIRDQYLIKKVQEVALFLLENYPEIANENIKRWVGGREKYGDIV